MKTGTIVGLIVGLLALVGVSMWWTATNQEARLRTSVEAEQKVCQVHFDNMWKTIQGIADVSSEYKDAFAELWRSVTATNEAERC